jgi:colicin import membrane protein
MSGVDLNVEVEIAEHHEAVAVALVNETVEAARAIEVRTPEQAQGAVEFLAKIADARKRSEAARKFLVEPMNRHVKAINDRFKQNAVPLDEADQLVRAKLLDFRKDEERRVAEEQARVDAERRKQEAEAEVERRRQAEEAERVERERQAAERARQAQLREAANERAREISMLDDGELGGLIARSPEDSDDMALARQEFASRQQAREARERADTARREAEEAQQREIAAKSAAAVTVRPTDLASASGSASTRKRWTATVTDATRIPREYLAVDQKAINAAVKEGVREIAGVTIEQVDELAVRAGGRS